MHEEFIYAVGYNQKISENPIVYITPKQYWQINNEIAYEYNDTQYDLLYDMSQEANMSQLMEGVYESNDPYATIEEIEIALEDAGFMRNDEFSNFIEETELS